jgi:hypothetical protein|tara:strand:- start:2441 stop:2692 length:252 start_codon:yes stop_codon:yes gene_type:complete
MSTTKLLKEELQQLRDFQSQDNEITFALGQIELRKVFIEKEKQNLQTRYQTQLQQQEKLGKELQEKYGDGNIDLEKGEFIKLE